MLYISQSFNCLYLVNQSISKDCALILSYILIHKELCNKYHIRKLNNHYKLQVAQMLHFPYQKLY